MASWCAEHGLDELQVFEPVHVAAYIETLHRQMSAPSILPQLAALRVLFDWPVVIVRAWTQANTRRQVGVGAPDRAARVPPSR